MRRYRNTMRTRQIPLFALLATCALPAIGYAAQACEKDPVFATAKADCQFGNQNLYYQPVCQDLYKYAAITDNLDAGSRAALEDLKTKIDAAKARPMEDQGTGFARARGIAAAGINTANLHLSATQLVLAQILSTRKEAMDSLKELLARNQSDTATYNYLNKGEGIPNTENAQALRRSQLADLTERVQSQAKAKQKIEAGVKQTVDLEKKLRALRGELVHFKNASVADLAKLPDPRDKTAATAENAVTEKLSKDDQSLWDKIKTNCFQDNGLRLGCSRALEAVDILSTGNIVTGTVKAIARKVLWKAFKSAMKSYFGDDTIKQLLMCGQGKGFDVFDLFYDEDMGTSNIPPVI
jgi:hypothetical protein